MRRQSLILVESGSVSKSRIVLSLNVVTKRERMLSGTEERARLAVVVVRSNKVA